MYSFLLTFLNRIVYVSYWEFFNSTQYCRFEPSVWILLPAYGVSENIKHFFCKNSETDKEITLYFDLKKTVNIIIKGLHFKD